MELNGDPRLSYSSFELRHLPADSNPSSYSFSTSSLSSTSAAVPSSVVAPSSQPAESSFAQSESSDEAEAPAQHAGQNLPPLPGARSKIAVKKKRDGAPTLTFNLIPVLDGIPPTVFYRGMVALQWSRTDWLSAQHVYDLIELAKATQMRCGPVVRPPSGSVFYFDVRTCVTYRHDDYDWIKKKGSANSVREDHVKLQLGKEPKVYASYVHSSEFLDPMTSQPCFHRRSYWILGTNPSERGVLVHYLLEKNHTGPSCEHPSDCPCLSCVITWHHEALGRPFEAFWAEEALKVRSSDKALTVCALSQDEAFKAQQKEEMERQRVLNAEKREQKRLQQSAQPPGSRKEAQPSRRKRDSNGEVVMPLQPPPQQAPSTPEWGHALDGFDEAMADELMYGKTDLFMLDLALSPPAVPPPSRGDVQLLSCVPASGIAEGDVVLCLLGHVDRRPPAGDWDLADVRVWFGATEVETVTRPLPGALQFAAPAPGPFRVQLGGRWLEAGGDGARKRPREADEAEADVGEAELDLHATVMVERAVRMMMASSGGLGADVINERSDNGFSFLHTVIYCGAKPEIAEMLLANGADPNARTEGGDTALHLAAEVGDADLARLLVQYRGDVRAKDKRGLTALEVARDYGHVSPALFAALGGASPPGTPLRSPRPTPPRPVGSPTVATREEHMRLLREALSSMTLKDQYTLTMAVTDRARSSSMAMPSTATTRGNPPLTHSRSQSMTDISDADAGMWRPISALGPSPPRNEMGPADDVSEVVVENQESVLDAMKDLAEPEREQLDREASVIQSNVRAWILRRQFLQVKEATKKVQAVAKGHLARKQFRELREKASATMVIQKSLRAHLKKKTAEAAGIDMRMSP